MPKLLEAGMEGTAPSAVLEASAPNLDSLGTRGVTGLIASVGPGPPIKRVVDRGGVGTEAGAGLAGELAGTGEAGGREGGLEAELSPESH